MNRAKAVKAMSKALGPDWGDALQEEFGRLEAEVVRLREIAAAVREQGRPSPSAGAGPRHK
jgi:hypothetical protein